MLYACFIFARCLLDRVNVVLVAWRGSNALCPINEDALHRAGLVLRWVTSCGQVNHLGM